MNALDFYFKQYKGRLDKYFGVKEDKGNYYLGDREIQVQDNNIHVDRHEFKGTTGLWALIMENTPNMGNIPDEDLKNYANLMEITNAMDVGLKESPRYAKTTDKYNLLKHLLGREEEEEEEKGGGGISFLPSDVNSLNKRLNILLAEFQAGNGATRNEIVAIVDNLVKRNKMKITVANNINNYIQNVHH